MSRMSNLPHMNNIIYPVQYRDLLPHQKLVFLAWPIRGAGKWKEEAMEIIMSDPENDDVVFASPERLNGEKLYTPGLKYIFERQRNWEQYYLRLAVQKWVVMFWFPKQHDPIEHENGFQKKAYGAISHLEVWQLMVTHPKRIIVGIHPEFNERSVIVNDLQQSNYLNLAVPYTPSEYAPVTISETLKDTAERTSALLKLLRTI